MNRHALLLCGLMLTVLPFQATMSVYGADEPVTDPAPSGEAVGTADATSQDAARPTDAEHAAQDAAAANDAAEAAAAGSDSQTDTDSDRQVDAGSDSQAESASSGTGDADPQPGPNSVSIRLTPQLLELRGRLRSCLAHYYHQQQDVAVRSPWGIMHEIIAYGVDTRVQVGDGQSANAIGWLCWNRDCTGQRLFYTNRRGRLQTSLGPGVQGHNGQFLAVLAQSKVRRDYGIRVDGQEFTVSDLVRHEQLTCEAGTELTFKLIGLMHYLDSDATWTNANGESWSIPKMIREELAQSVVDAACGGTHRMMGFSYAVRKREKRKEPFVGQWARAKKFVEDYHDYTLQLQNSDGSFSTNFFRGPGHHGDIDLRMETSGHILEWLVFSLPKEELDDPRVVRAVDYLTNLLLDNRQRDWAIGPKGHALHALALYDERVFGGRPGSREFQLVRRLPDSSSR